MAKIRVRCPACDSDLELDDSHEGQEVECGSCLHLFIARYSGPAPAAGGGAIPGLAPPAPAPRRAPDPDEDDDGRDDDAGDRAPRPRAGRAKPAGDAPRPDADAEPPPARPLPRDNEEFRDYRDEDGDYEYDEEELDGPPPPGSNGYNGIATASLVFGTLSVVMILMTLPFICCCMVLPLPFISPLGVAALVTGALGLRADSDRKPLAVLGLLLGLLSLGFIVLQLTFGLVRLQNPGQ
jgi:hypothetical protein